MRWGPSPAPPGLWPVIHSEEAQEKLGPPGNPQSRGSAAQRQSPALEGANGKCPTPVGPLGRDTGFRGQPGHFTTSTQVSLSSKLVIPFFSVVEDIPSCSHLTE